MSTALQFYLATALVYFGVDLIACWAFNMQLRAGVLNFAFIVFQAAGAYTQAVLTLGPQTNNSGYQSYVFGNELPFPIPMVIAMAVGAAIALPVGWLVLRRLDRDLHGLTFIVVSLIATRLVEIQVNWFNGPTGLSLIPQPLSGTVLANVAPQDYSWLYVAFTGVICVAVYYVVHRITSSPLGRTLRSLDDNEPAAAALGKAVTANKVMIFVVGGALGALSGAVLVAFIGAWAPSGWLYSETFVLAAAIIIGGRGNNLGVLIGAALVPVGFFEGTRFLPAFGPPGLIDAIQWMAIGLLFLVFLWFRPIGILPERRRIFPPPGSAPKTSRWRALRWGIGSAPRLAVASAGAAPAASAPRWPAGQAASSGRLSDAPSASRTGRVASVVEAVALLSVTNLRRGFGGVQAVDDVSFEVPAGQTIGLIGPNGAGKSTVVSLIAGALKPDSGTIRLKGHEIAGKAPHVIARQGLVRTFQLSSQFSSLTVMENLLTAVPGQRGDTLSGALFSARRWRHQERDSVARAWELLRRFEMVPKASEYAGNLSGGQRRLVEVMRALMAEPQLLLLDEPMAGVSPVLAEQIEAHLATLQAEGLAMLIVEHELGVIDRLCQSVVVMAEGKVIAQGPMATIRRSQEVVDAYIGA